MGNGIYFPEAVDVIADVCREIIDVRFEVVPGAKTYGYKNYSFEPDGIVDHHTGPGSFKALRDYVHHGSRIAPLCNELISNPKHTDNVCIVSIIACGRANHAGSGTLPDGSSGTGNKRRWGREFQNTGSEGWHPLQLEVGVRIDAALCKAFGWEPKTAHQEHKEYAGNRKPDRHGIDGPAYRKVIKDRMRSRTVEALRIAGSDRHDTQAKIALTRFGEGKWPVVYIALTGSPEIAASGMLGGPVLSVTKDSVPAATAAALETHNPDKIVALGGTGAVPEHILQECKRIATD